jgi:heat-inducible transcriptional repressor
MSAVVETLVEAFSDHRSDERIAVGGAANLARFGESFDTAVRPLLEALEEHVVLLKLLGEAHTGDAVTVRIGAEGPYQELAATSVVATGYGPGDDALATLGIDGRRACRGPLRVPDPRPGMTSSPTASPPRR